MDSFAKCILKDRQILSLHHLNDFSNILCAELFKSKIVNYRFERHTETINTENSENEKNLLRTTGVILAG